MLYPHPVLRRARAGAWSQPVLRSLARRSWLSPTPPTVSRPAPRPLHCRKRQQIPAAPAGLADSFGVSRVARAAAKGKGRAAAEGSVGARRVSALSGRGSRRCSCGGCCWRWRLLKLLLGLLALWLLASRWLLGPGLCFLVLLADPLDHSAPVQRASFAPGTWGLRSVCGDLCRTQAPLHLRDAKETGDITPEQTEPAGCQSPQPFLLPTAVTEPSGQLASPETHCLPIFVISGM